MKIVIINYEDCNGAGLCAYRIHRSLIALGHDSTMLVLRKTQDDDTVIQIGKWRNFLWKALNKILRILGLTLTDYNRVIKLSVKYNAAFTLPVTVFDLSRYNAVCEADVVHLHWVGNMLDFRTFFDRVKKPIVWTLHDENLFFGISHYAKQSLPENPLEKKYYDLKMAKVSRLDNLGIVFLSRMMFEQYSGNELIFHASKCIIHNSVDTTVFKPLDKRRARHRWNIPDDTTVLVFVAAGIFDPRKQLRTLLEAVEKINTDKNIVVLAVGGNPTGETAENLITTGSLNNISDLSEAYSTADYFVMPSLQEAFAQTPIEAMACGLPAIVTPVSGTEELITHMNGVRTKDFTTNSLIEALQKAFTIHYDSTCIRAYVQSHFSPEEIGRQYVSFYQQMLEKCNLKN